jgi:hypothetical protein
MDLLGPRLSSEDSPSVGELEIVGVDGNLSREKASALRDLSTISLRALGCTEVERSPR